MAKRTNTWASIYYGNDIKALSAQLRDFHIPFLISPCHDQDTDDDGVLKKAHYHVMLLFDSLKSKDQATDLFGTAQCIGCEPVYSRTAYARYLCHMDEPDKVVYDASDVVAYGVDYASVCQQPIDRSSVTLRVLDMLNEGAPSRFFAFLQYVSKRDMDVFKLCTDSPFLVKTILSSYDPRFDRPTDICCGDENPAEKSSPL